MPLNTLAAQRLLQQVRPWLKPAQSHEKNQLGLGTLFFNSLRLTWCLALLADAVVAGELRADTDVRALARMIEVTLGGSFLAWTIYREGPAAKHLREDLDATLRPYLTHGRRAGRVRT